MRMHFDYTFIVISAARFPKKRRDKINIFNTDCSKFYALTVSFYCHAWELCRLKDHRILQKLLEFVETCQCCVAADDTVLGTRIVDSEYYFERHELDAKVEAGLDE